MCDQLVDDGGDAGKAALFGECAQALQFIWGVAGHGFSFLCDESYWMAHILYVQFVHDGGGMIEYDEEKRLANIAKHGFDFVGAEHVFAGFHITREDSRNAYGEQRFQTLGLYGGVVVVVMAHTVRDDRDRIISIRKATTHEEKYYWQHYPG